MEDWLQYLNKIQIIEVLHQEIRITEVFTQKMESLCNLNFLKQNLYDSKFR